MHISGGERISGVVTVQSHKWLVRSTDQYSTGKVQKPGTIGSGINVHCGMGEGGTRANRGTLSLAKGLHCIISDMTAIGAKFSQAKREQHLLGKTLL